MKKKADVMDKNIFIFESLSSNLFFVHSKNEIL